MKKPSEWISNFNSNMQYRPLFPVNNFSKSCLIYSKGGYGIFLLTTPTNDKYVVKVSRSFDEGEGPISLYIKHFASHIPNILHIIDIYIDNNPISIPLFNNVELDEPMCRVRDIDRIFVERYLNYMYFLTKACDANLAAYLGRLKNTLTYEQFVGYSFQVLVGLQTLHRLGVWHRDIKPANYLICNSENKDKNILYNYNNQRYWSFSHNMLKGKGLKLIDFGEARVRDNVDNSCLEFKNEVQVSSAEIIKLMWKYVIDKRNEDLYNELIGNLNNCNTNLVTVMFSSSIFDPYVVSDYNPTNTHKVDLLPY